MSYATCRAPGCGRRVMWVKTPNGRNMPVDVDPVGPTSARSLLPEDRRRDVFVIITDAGAFSCEPRLHRSHWASCPGAAHFRNRQNSEGKKE